MRLIPLLIFILMGCSSQQLNYKYSSTKRYLASLSTKSEAKVHRMEVALRDEVLFASGMDSTFIVVRLFNVDGELLQNVDPSDLTLSTNVDIKAKPFTFKQGVYKAEVLPKVKSGNIMMRVDWQGKILSDEVVIKTTVKPLRESLIPVHHDFMESKHFGDIDLARGSGTPENLTDGFSLSNVGDNRIVNSKILESSRSFSFDYLERAKQNLSLQVSDSYTDHDAYTLNSLFMLFPRKQLFTVEQLSGTLNVTLPTGEKMIFSKKSKEIVGGVFVEGPIDTNLEIEKRQFPDLKYQGKGVLLRANAEGQPPELGHASEVLIIQGESGRRCLRPKADFWEPIEVNPVEFKFPSDEEFERYLKKHCGFGLPKL